MTVILPVYNSAGTVGTTIRSILGQTDEDFELLIVDDKSADDSLEVIHALQKETGDPRIRVLEHESNRGVSAARNTALRCATGEFVSFVDSDDEYHPDFLRRMREAMADDVDLVVCGRQMHVAGQQPYVRTGPRLGRFPGGVAARMAMVDKITPFACDKMMRRSIFDGLGYPEGAARFEDMATNILLHTRSRHVRIIPDPLYRYNVGGQSATWGRIPTIADTEAVLDHLERHLPAEYKTGSSAKFYEGLRTFVVLQVAQSAIARPARSPEADAVVRECRQTITAASVVRLLSCNAVIGIAAGFFKVLPASYSALYRWHIGRRFGISST